MFTTILEQFPHFIQIIIVVILQGIVWGVYINDITLERISNLHEAIVARRNKKKLYKILKYHPSIAFINILKRGLNNKSDREVIQSLLDKKPLIK